jgi:hypothetical protein
LLPHVSRAAITEVLIDDKHPIQTISPREAIGGGVDGHEKGETAQLLSAHNIEAMLASGLGPLTYRLRTELGDEVWHWNPKGIWSDPIHHCGYWTSSAELAEPIAVSYGYRLPHRGNTIDQADNDGYSRIDDGNPSTYWKSNPYLDAHFTGEPNELHPQWIIVDLGSRRPVDALRIHWSEPFATSYRIEYWTGNDPMHLQADNRDNWRSFPEAIAHPSGKTPKLQRLASAPVRVRFVRIVLLSSSSVSVDRDIRGRLGYTVCELELGRLDHAGKLVDYIKHSPTRTGQTTIYVSSTDPWHRAEDIDEDCEQPGLDFVLAGKLTKQLPALVPVGLLYDTPENSAAELTYLRARKYPLLGVELGEEPDGQWVEPEDYGALFRQVATRLHAIDPAVKLGGPSLQSFDERLMTWADERGNRHWMNRLLKYLMNAGSAPAFVSFEFYPFDDVCTRADDKLPHVAQKLGAVLASLREDGARFPLYLTEFGYSVFAGKPEVKFDGALFDAEVLAAFFTNGGNKAYLYGYEPNVLADELKCSSWGNLMLLQMDETSHQLNRLAAFESVRLVTKSWLASPHEVTFYRARTADPKLAAYAVLTKDKTWSLLLLNKNRAQAKIIRPVLAGRSTQPLFRGETERVEYSRAQYAWHSDGAHGSPSRDLPPKKSCSPAASQYSLPPYSITILRGKN